MNIIHTADLHIDSKMESKLSSAQAAERRNELIDTFERLVSYARTNAVSVIMITGDMFDRPHIKKRTKSRILDMIREYEEIDFLYLCGNHDKTDLLSELATNEIPSNLKLFTDEVWTTYIYGDVCITGRELKEDNAKSLAVNLILDQTKCNIVMLHGQEPGYVGTDRTQIVNLAELKNKFIDYLALGHIHSYKADRLDERGVYCYSGCLEGRSFDECGDKGFVFLTIDDDTKELAYRFVPFAKRKMHEVDVSVTEDMNMPMVLKEIEDGCRDIPSKDLVKVVLTGTTEMDFDVDTEKIVHKLSKQFFFVKVSDKTVTRIDYDSFLNDRSLKGEFVRLMQKQDMEEDQKAGIIELGMKAILGEEIEE